MEQARLLSFILVKQLSQVKSEQTNELNVKSLKSFEVFKVVVNEVTTFFQRRNSMALGLLSCPKISS